MKGSGGYVAATVPKLKVIWRKMIGKENELNQ